MDNTTKQLQLTDIRRPDADVPYIDPRTLYGTPDRHDDLLHNTSVEDAVRSQPEALLNGTINQRLARLNDKQNQYNILKKRLSNVDQEIAQESYGRGITALGRKPQQITRARQLEAEGDLVLSDIEALRGNIETSERLAREARAKASSSGYDFSSINASDTQSTITDLNGDGLVNEVDAQLSQEVQLLDSQYSELYSAGRVNLDPLQFMLLPAKDKADILRKEYNKNERSEFKSEQIDKIRTGFNNNKESILNTGSFIAGSAIPAAQPLIGAYNILRRL